MTAREQLLLAREHGHELSVYQRGPWPEHGDPHPKWYIACTCGWKGSAVRSRKATNASLIWHMSKAIADILEGQARDGGTRGTTARQQAGGAGALVAGTEGH